MNNTEVWNSISQFDKEDRGVYCGDNLMYPYKNEKEIKEHHNKYIYVEITDSNKVYLKFGHCKTSIYERYKGGQKTIKEYHTCIWLGDSDKGDKVGHKYLREQAKIHGLYRHVIGDEANHTNENYEMTYGKKSIERFIKDVEDFYSTKDVKQEIPLYEDIKHLVKEVFMSIEKYIILYLCPRWGKTRTNLSLMQLHNMVGHRISIMFSYVGTVRNSYVADLKTIKQYENIKFIDVDEIKNIDETVNEINDWLENLENHIMIYFSLTGDTKCFKKREEILNKLNQYEKIVFVEEADFGAHCDNSTDENLSQLKKVNSIVEKFKVPNIYITTGTGYEKILKFVQGKDYKLFDKEYITDILTNSK